MQLFAGWWAKQKQEEAKRKTDANKRQADGEGSFVTRQELNDALAHFAQRNGEMQKQAQSDLLTAIREEIQRNGQHTPTDGERAQPMPAQAGAPATPFYYASPMRGAAGGDQCCYSHLPVHLRPIASG